MWVVFAAARKPSLRRLALLVASYLFYFTWGPAFLVVLIASSVFNFLWGRVLLRRPLTSLLWLGLGANILLLASFKYAGWLLGAFTISNSLLTNILGAVGVSFYTFQGMSHLLDVYREVEHPTPTLVEFLLYMAFWPTVLSGPICRVGELIPQFRRMSTPALDDVSTGVQRILFGLFMKVVLADTLGFGLLAGEGVNTGFNSISKGWSGVDVWFLAIGFGFQLYFDFAGYSHMAIGSARLFGIQLRENFNHPYISLTPSDFWTRWHMSLSFWIRDYLFLPLAMRRREFSWRILATIFSMTVFGIWHGAGANFLLWGVYHGVLLAGHRILQQFGRRIRGDVERFRFLGLGKRIASWTVTFLLICLGWVLFRANNLAQAGAMLRAVFAPRGYFKPTLRPNFYVLIICVVAGYFGYMALRQLWRSFERYPVVARLGWAVSPVLYCAQIVAIIVWSRQAATFVYLQF
ncbi:MAG TPA: MBOAT family O-acyltransferase [Pyrinomonadaceae bacterium]|nr:MBOAT family O-acyltransferase [Pyrinomonadaceae bacterium]